MKKNGFTLIETLVVVAIIAALFTLSIPTFSRFSAQLSLNTSAKALASKLRAIQTQAVTQHKTLSLDFAKTELASGISILKTSKISFSSSGSPPPGGSGTLMLQNKFGKTKKIIVSSAGRVRVE